jgi:hypothetical protein
MSRNVFVGTAQVLGLALDPVRKIEKGSAQETLDSLIYHRPNIGAKERAQEQYYALEKDAALSIMMKLSTEIGSDPIIFEDPCVGDAFVPLQALKYLRIAGYNLGDINKERLEETVETLAQVIPTDVTISYIGTFMDLFDSRVGETHIPNLVYFNPPLDPERYPSCLQYIFNVC